MLSKLAIQSLLARKTTVLLAAVSIAISLFVLLAIHHVKSQAKAGFTQTVSGVDLIVGARTGQLNLLLYSVFRIGNATNNIEWESYQFLSNAREVAWAIPLSLGDSHKGFRVLGTSEAYFEHYRFAGKRTLEFTLGQPFAGTYEAVIGAEVARKLGYQLGQQIVLAHGIGAQSFTEHSAHPFEVVGILAPTGTPVDQTVHVRLDGIEAIHLGMPGASLPTDAQSALTPKSITAMMVGLKSKLATFSFQRKVNEFRAEPLLAILPGVALAELWQMMGVIENILLAISWMVLMAALVGLVTMMLAAMRERRQEFLVLRAVGASPLFIFALIQLEVILVTFVSLVTALLVLWLGLQLSQELLVTQLGLAISANLMTAEIFLPIGYVSVTALLIGFIPAAVAYRETSRRL